jgi:hypothetical protein
LFHFGNASAHRQGNGFNLQITRPEQGPDLSTSRLAQLLGSEFSNSLKHHTTQPKVSNGEQLGS